MAGTGDDAKVRLVRRQAAKMRTNCREREEALCCAHYVDRRLRIKRDRVGSIAVGFPGINNGRWFVEHIRRQVLVSESGSSQRRNSDGTNAHLHKELPPAHLSWTVGRNRWFGV